MGNLLMVYDTETTGKGDFNAPFNDANQPHLVQLGYKVYDPITRETVFEIGHLVDSTEMPTWKGIEPGAQAVHGITEELIKAYGISPDSAMKGFNRWAERCSLFIAHNDQFDTRIMMCHAYRAGWSPDIFSTGTKFCTMKTNTNICKIPNAKGYGFKWPTLQEAYAYYTNGKSFSGAHNALVDVNACGEIFWEMINRDLIKILGINASLS